jgi:hypothetical protein
MSLPLTNVVNVAITRQTVFPQGPGFGTLLIVGPNSTGVIPLGERIRFYDSIAGVGDDFAAITEEYKTANAYFAQSPRPIRVAIGVRDQTNPSVDIGDEMDAIVDASDDWYGVMLTADARISIDADAAIALAAWTEARTKLFVTTSNEAAAIAAGGGLPGALNTLGYNRTACFYHPDADTDTVNSYPEASFFGSMLTVDFNGVNTTKTGSFRTLPGISVTDLTQSEFDFLLTNKGNGYVSIAGTSMVREGTMASGEFFDVMHGVDWLQAEIAFRVFGMLATLPKVPYTNAGMEILVNQVRLALQQGVNNGLLAANFDDDGNLLDAYEVSVPNVLTVSEANRAARIAPPISFTARLSGAVHFATVNGTVTI